MSACVFICFFKQKTAYEMRISDWSSDVCSSDLRAPPLTIGATPRSSKAVLALDPAHRARTGAHHHAFGRHPAAHPLDAFEQRAIGDAGGREDAIARGEIVELVDLVEIVDPPFARPRAFVVVAEHQPALELPTDAAQRRRGDHAFGRSEEN